MDPEKRVSRTHSEGSKPQPDVNWNAEENQQQQQWDRPQKERMSTFGLYRLRQRPLATVRLISLDRASWEKTLRSTGA